MRGHCHWLQSSVMFATLVLLLAFAATGMSAGQQTRAAADEGPKIIAIKFHADWCGYCKAMGPVFEELQAKYDRLPVLYVTFEQTREFGRRQSRYLADAMGLNDTWAENGGKTGFVLLIDARSKRIVNRLSHKQTLKQMGAALQAAVESTS